MRTLLLTLALSAAGVAATSRGQSATEPTVHVRASDVGWDAQPNLPEPLRQVVRWKTLIGSPDAIPQTDLSFGELELAPQAIYPGHLHPAPEMYYVLEGRVEWTVGDETFIAEAGTALYTAPGTVHRMVNLGDDVARAVWAWWAPGGDGSVMATGYRITEELPEQPEAARFPDGH